MPKRSTKSSQDFQKLLDEQQAVTQWLERLGDSGDDASDEVRAKVRADYETRLNAVSEELRDFRDELRDTLSTQTDKRDDLSQKERSADTRLGEAKLRHSVGEYEEARWNEVESEILEELGKVREELKDVDAEIARLDDLLAAIDQKPQKVEPPEVKSEAELVSLAELDDAEPDSLGTDLDSGEGGDRKPPRTGGQTDAFDELAFLKKVSPEGTGLRRRSGATFKPIDPADLPEPTPSPVPEPTPPAPPEPMPTAPENTLDLTKEDDTARKTLKCQECGAMNRPTEWYCESCGAELAAV